jgi:hypothetical protein
VEATFKIPPRRRSSIPGSSKAVSRVSAAILTSIISNCRPRPLDRPPVPAVLLSLIVFLLYQAEAACAQARAFAAPGFGR